MFIVRPTLLVDVKKMEHSFQMGYEKGNKVFYVSTTNNKGVQEMVTPELLSSWDIRRQANNAKFEEYLRVDPNLKKTIQYDFSMWDGNHKFQTQLPFIDRVHKHEENWHVDVDSIIFNNTRGVVKLLITMMN
jgi:hypothetical protein